MELKGAVRETEISQDQLYRGLITLDAIMEMYASFNERTEILKILLRS